MSSSSAAPSVAPAAAAAAAAPVAAERFAGRVHTKGDKNLQWAQEEYSREDRAMRLVIWTDGSLEQTNAHSDQREGGPEGTNASSAVIWRQDLGGNDWEWDDEVVVHAGTTTIRRAELHALFMAFQRAQMILDSPAGAGKTSVCIYSDNLRCVEGIKWYRGNAQNGWGRELFGRIVQLTKDIRERGVQIELAWIPGHAEVEGNSLADYIAKRASGKLWPAPSRSEFLRMEHRANAANATAGDRRTFAQVQETSRARQVFNRRDQARALRRLGKCLETSRSPSKKATITALRQQPNDYLIFSVRLVPSVRRQHYHRHHHHHHFRRHLLSSHNLREANPR